MKKIALLSLVLILVLACSSIIIVSASPFTSISVKDARKMIMGNKYPEMIKMDVRPFSMFAEGHIPGAINVPMSDLSAWITNDAGEHLETEILVNCHLGIASEIAAGILEVAGYTKVFSLAGGFTAWADAGYQVEITSVMFLNAEIINNNPVGMNIISGRELVGTFTAGPFEGDIYREIRVVMHTKTGKATVQNIVYVENAVVTIDEEVAEGSFVMKVMGMVGNAKWTIISSDLTVDGEAVNLHGQGTATVTAFIPIDATHYNIENTLTGQVSLTP